MSKNTRNKDQYIIKCKFSDLSLIGDSYNITKTALLVLDLALCVKYANTHATYIFGCDSADFIDKSLEEICKLLKLPNLVDPITLHVISQPVHMISTVKMWRLNPVLIDNQEYFFLTDKTAPFPEDIHDTLATKLEKVTGQIVHGKQDLLWYFDEITHWMEAIIHQMPGYIYFKNTDYKYVFCNENIANSLGFDSINDVVGKTDYDFGWDKLVVDQYRKIDKEIIESGQAKLGIEEVVTTKDNKKLYLLVNKIPMRSKSGEIIGIIGINIDINDRKQAEFLKLENQAYKTATEEQEKFKKIVGQMAHDIRSPLSTLKTFSQNIANIPETDRLTLKRVAMNIEDIASHVLNRYKGDNALTENNIRQHVLVAAALSEIASERRYKYANSNVQFEFVVTNPPVNNFVFVQIEPSSLYRMVSNLINNACEALPKTGGKIIVTLMSSLQWVEIVVQDNGKGMTPATFEKVRQRKAVKSNKKQGSGLGLTQIFDTLEHNLGEFEIYSSNKAPNNGTVVRVRLPKAVTQNWIATEIKIKYNDSIVIIDDDESIHEAWDKRLCNIIESISTIQVYHYRDGRDALRFLMNLENKQNVLLLSDYELIGQDVNGLDIIEQSEINRSILVTSHYAESAIRSKANKLGAKILPKDIVYSIPIKVEHASPKHGQPVNVHMVFVDDEIDTIERLIANHYSHLLIDIYPNPFEFLKEVDKYPKDTKIIIDNNFYNDGKKIVEVDGAVIAKQLHAKGYTKLYLYSWENCSVPEYVTFILKTDRDTMARLDKIS
ncbi:MAG: PAS domain-containing protein [Burkholderiales bacterium]|nr:PAS domain-containing protein [Burkholderiales bacterium]